MLIVDMKIIKYYKYLVFIFIIFLGILSGSCSNKNVVPTSQIQRLRNYIKSDNIYIAEMFSEDQATNCGVQPALTQAELNVLDVLADRISPEVRKIFDQKYTAWLNCWTPLDSLPEQGIIRQSLKCNGSEFQELIEFCKQQDDDIFLLLYQLAARADCPYDQLLLHPVHDLLGNFPEFNKYWREVDVSLQNEKPSLKDRTCNEATIWYTRKILETKYGYTYASGVTSLFDTRKMLLMTQ